MTVIGAAELRPGDPCTAEYRGEAVEEEHRVTVTVLQRSPVANTDFGCTLEGYSRLVEVALQDPLGERIVVDGSADVERVVFDGSKLYAPSHLPDGWEQRLDRPGSAVDGSAVWRRHYGPAVASPGDGPCGQTQPGAAVVQGRVGAFDLRDYDVVATHDMGDRVVHYLENRRNPQLRMVRWEQGDEAVQVETWAWCGKKPLVDETMLVEIAGSLTR